MDPNEQRRELAAVLLEQARAKYGREVDVENLLQLSGGASRETWRFDLLRGTQRSSLILKRDPVLFDAEGGITTVATHLGVDRLTEGRLMEIAAQHGVPVPEVAFFVEESLRTTAGFVTFELPGEALGTRILRSAALADARKHLAWQCGEAAARFHAIPLEELPAMERLDTDQEFDYYRTTMRSFGHPQPGFEYGLRWLEERRELAGDGLTLVHADYRNGNILVDATGLRGVLDWEGAHLGNPLIDLGWMCVAAWRYGVYARRVGGFGELEELLGGYEAAGGGRVDPESVRFWEIFGTIRWGILCMIMSFNHLNGKERSLEKAVIGRRTAETEYDLLQLIDAAPR